MIDRLVIEDGPTEVTLRIFLLPHLYVENNFMVEDLKAVLLNQISPELFEQLGVVVDDFAYHTAYMDRSFYPAWTSRIDVTHFKKSADELLNNTED